MVSHMQRLFIAALAAACLYGCSKPAAEAPTTPTRTAAGPPGAASSGSDVTPIGAGAGPMTPVVGGENLGGTTGGGGAHWRKNKARSTATQQSSPPVEGGGDEGSTGQ